MELNFYNYMVYASQYLLLYEVLENKHIRTYNDLPQEIKDKIPLSYSDWLDANKPKKSVSLSLKYDYI